MTHDRRVRRAIVVLLLLPLAVLLLVRPFDDRLGLMGTYYSRVDWSGARFTRIDYQIATGELARGFEYAGNRPFAVTWEGLLAIEQPGTYRFEIVSDDGSTVRIDGHWLINISGTHGPLAARGVMNLAAGLHPIQIDFYEAGGGWKIDLFWARDDGEFVRVPPAVLLHRPMSMTEYRVLRRLSAVAGVAPLCWIAAGLLMAASRVKRWITPVRAHLRWSPLLGVLLASLLLNVLGIWWGFPDGWAADEIGPGDAVAALKAWFSGGWYSKYPLLHYYILGLFSTPFLIADLLRPSDQNAQGMFQTLFIVNRLVSVAMATGTIVTCYFCGLRLQGRLAGVLAAATTAAVLPFIYYSKVVNLDVPCLFWFAVSMFAYIRIIQGGPPSAYRLFALTATLAICTKDQAYGFYVLPIIHVVVLRYRQLARVHRHPWSRLVRDRVLMGAAAIALIAFVAGDNVLFNYSGFLEHVRLITGGASTGYQMVPNTLDGRLQLLFDTVRLVRWSFGWPLFLVAVAALTATVINRDSAGWLLLPALSYYLFFLNVVLYVYDRFLLGICLLLAIIMACRLAEWVAQRGAIRLAAVAAAGVGFAYAFLTAASMDAMMIGDSRYAVERWARAHVPHDASIALVGRPEYLPILDDFIFKHIDAEYPAEALAYGYVVVNVKYMRRYPSGSATDAFYQKLRSGDGYSLVLREGPALPWLPLTRDPVFRSDREDPYTNLAKVDPGVEIYKKLGG